MMRKKFLAILVLAALLVATQVADVEAGSIDRKVDKTPRKDENDDKDKTGTDVRKTGGGSGYDYYYGG